MTFLPPEIVPLPEMLFMFSMMRVPLFVRVRLFVSCAPAGTVRVSPALMTAASPLKA